uniref:RING-type domain-containing protein n=1 Tax=viral metagenome TaxID=1070528 RepID=A0A6C0F6A8_9ZZZZ|tara:strand:- start:5413 stop:6168 length:756 start_codon:yes stop_codon:yes gene_type:complete
MDASTFAYVDAGFAPVPVDTNSNNSMNINVMQQQINQDLVRRDPQQLADTHALIDEISEIRDKLYPYIEGIHRQEIGCESKELHAIKQSLHATIQTVKDVYLHMNTQMKKVDTLEKQYKNELDTVHRNVSKLTDFIDFLNILIAKHDDLDITEIVKGIRTIIHTLSDNTSIKLLHDSYKFESSLLQYYIEHFVKPINGGNMGTTCSICMQRSVNRFLDPCGHTICSECLQECQDSCFICRSHIIQSRPLYL